MKASGSIKLFTISILMFVISGAFAQEYDDMYFSHSDRKAELKKNDEVFAKNTSVRNEPQKSTSDYGAVDENYSSKNVNPEYIARYRDSKDADSNEGDSYYVEDYNRTGNTSDSNSDGKIINNYYYNSMNPYYPFANSYSYNPYAYSSFYDPLNKPQPPQKRVLTFLNRNRGGK